MRVCACVSLCVYVSVCDSLACTNTPPSLTHIHTYTLARAGESVPQMKETLRNFEDQAALVRACVCVYIYVCMYTV